MRLFLLAALVTCAASALADAGFRYSVGSATVTVVPTLGGSQNTGLDINDAGSIVGWSLTPKGQRRAFLYRPKGALIDITAPLGERESEAHGINNRDEVVGFSDDGSGPRAFRYSSTGLVQLADQDSVRRPRPPGSRATAIADNGLISGSRLLYYPYLDGFNYVTNATTWRDEYHFTQLDEERYTYRSWTLDVNSLGMVTGYASDRGDSVAVLWTVRDGVVSGRTRFEVPIAHGLEPAAVNEHGHVAGYVSTWEDGRSWNRAVIWNGWTGELTHVLGVLPTGTESTAEDINDGGFIAGFADETIPTLPPAPTYLRNRAFLYHPHFGMYGLPRPAITGFHNCQAAALGEVATATGLLRLTGTCDTATGPRAVRWDVILRRIPTTPPGPTP